MTHIRITISCDDCGIDFGEDTYDSVADADIEARGCGWEAVRIHRREFHFCPKCQTSEPAKAAGQ